MKLLLLFFVISWVENANTEQREKKKTFLSLGLTLDGVRVDHPGLQVPAFLRWSDQAWNLSLLEGKKEEWTGRKSVITIKSVPSESDWVNT